MISSKQLVARVQGAFGFLDDCEDNIYQEFLSAAIHVKLKKGQCIFKQGDDCTHLALMLGGAARIYTLADSGREITLYRIEAGQSCILTASCVQSNHPFPAFAVCESNIDAILIPANCLQKWLAESTAWRDFIFGLISQRMTSVICLVEEVAFNKLDQRIAKLLIQSMYKNTALIIHITHHEIALELGTSREVVSRILLSFQRAGLVNLTRGLIIINDFEAMRTRAGDVKNSKVA